jgi:hypothetical protein
MITLDQQLPYFPAYKTHQPIRRTMIFSLEILEKYDDECILILVIYWKKTGLLHILLQESKPFTNSDARSHDLEANFSNLLEENRIVTYLVTRK